MAATTEPTIGLIRLAWWREALERLDSAPPPAEPLLAALAAHCLPRGVSGAMLAAIEDGWAALLDGEPAAAAVTRHGRERGTKLFALSAVLLTRHAGLGPPFTPDQGDDKVEAAGAAWALTDLGYHHSTLTVRAEALGQACIALDEAPKYWLKSLRPLGALVVLARRDAAAETRAQGSPERLLRMLALRVTGL